MIEKPDNSSHKPTPLFSPAPAHPVAARPPAKNLGIALVSLILVAAAPLAMAQGSGYTLIGWNDLGMHCMDADYSVFSILPPYNVIHAQILDPSGNLITNPDALGITVTYEGVADPDGSINTTSVGKTNFWDWVVSLFGPATASLVPDQGLAGSDMPGPVNDPQPMHFDTGFDWFSAEGIPITPWDDSDAKNYYPMMKLVARNASGSVLATTRIVLPVSDEMSCASCHGPSSIGSEAMPRGGWITDSDPEREYRLNILLLHDQLQEGSTQFTDALATAGYNTLGLYATVTSDGKSILCDNCHGSNALPGTGQAGISPLTEAVHSLHAGVTDHSNGMTLDASANRTACYTCHPGSDTRCLRGAMGAAVASNGDLSMQCQSCHGNMSRVGAEGRAGWFDQPTCQNCHTGTATNNNGQIRYLSALDGSGNPRVAVNNTFATSPNAPVAGVSLYRFSTGHGGLQCEACHGSTHAIYPSSHLNDNLQSIDQQGHKGTLSDCSGCHSSTPRTVTGGPHGMHPIGQSWIRDHHDAVNDHNVGQCATCHGADYRGTVLSRAQGDRTFSAFGTKNFWQGFQIGCYNCHRGPSSSSGNSNRAPVVSDVSASTDEGVPVEIPLSASDADGNSLTLRIVSQPANGTVGLVGTVATFYPFAGFSGSDAFTYAAWDGSTNSNLGNGSVTVADTGGPPCTVDCSATVDATGEVDSPASFSGHAVLSDCVGGASYAWEFGDGSTGSGADTSHAYSAPGTYDWTLTVTANGITCTTSGSIEISEVPQCSVSCSATVDSSGEVGSSASFSGNSDLSNCAGGATYAWEFGDGSTGSGANTTHTYSAPGTYNWSLTVTADGATCTKSGSIEIAPAETQCSLTCSAEVKGKSRVGKWVEFHGSSESSNCSGSKVYVWNFGDGSAQSNGRELRHKYTAAGTYRWLLEVRQDGAVCQTSRAIVIQPSGGGSRTPSGRLTPQ
jgi:PKD repeat protein